MEAAGARSARRLRTPTLRGPSTTSTTTHLTLPLIEDLGVVHALVNRRKTEVLRDLDLLPAHHAALVVLMAHPRINRTDLARPLRLSHQACSHMIRRLQDRGLVEPSRGPNRPRAPRVGPRGADFQLTDEGVRTGREAEARISTVEGLVRRVLDDDQVAVLQEALELLRQALDREDPEGTENTGDTADADERAAVRTRSGDHDRGPV